MFLCVWVHDQFIVRRGEDLDVEAQIGKTSFIDLAGSERGADTYDNDRCAYWSFRPVEDGPILCLGC